LQELAKLADEPAELIEHITNAGRLLALIISGRFRKPGIHFFTPDEFSQQLAYMQHPAGKLIAPHVHNPVPREVQLTQEVLFIRKGRLRVDFYGHHQCYLRSRILEAGDIILLIEGGHGFEVLEDVEMIEVKQGPYAGEHDKTRFKGISRADVRLAPETPHSGK
jgi:mannose-6-phosphate isomerase-like protein (cupin superfamily)